MARDKVRAMSFPTAVRILADGPPKKHLGPDLLWVPVKFGGFPTAVRILVSGSGFQLPLFRWIGLVSAFFLVVWSVKEGLTHLDSKPGVQIPKPPTQTTN